MNEGPPWHVATPPRGEAERMAIKCEISRQSLVTLCWKHGVERPAISSFWASLNNPMLFNAGNKSAFWLQYWEKLNAQRAIGISASAPYHLKLRALAGAEPRAAPAALKIQAEMLSKFNLLCVHAGLILSCQYQSISVFDDDEKCLRVAIDNLLFQNKVKYHNIY